MEIKDILLFHPDGNLASPSRGETVFRLPPTSCRIDSASPSHCMSIFPSPSNRLLRAVLICSLYRQKHANYGFGARFQ
jgi:hypothetical protein